MTLRIVRLGSARAPGEGLRIGAVRRPPRGVPKSEFASRDFYDAWLPALSPSAELVKQALAASDDGEWAAVRAPVSRRAEHCRREAAARPAGGAVASRKPVDRLLLRR